MPQARIVLMFFIPIELLFFDADIAEKLEQAQSSKYIDDAVFSAKQAQRMIDACKKSRHPFARSIAAKRQAELDAILSAPWAPGVLFEGALLCLKNNPGDPWEGYQPTDGERANIQGQIPWENRKGERLPRQSRHLLGPTIIQPRY